MGSATKKERQEAFEQEQDQARSAQGLTSPNSVPEKRPQASQQLDESSESEVYREEVENGERDPMPFEAHDQASSDAQAKKAEKTSNKLGNEGIETLREGAKVRVVDHPPYDGAVGVVEGVTYASPEDAAQARSGDPAVARFAKCSAYSIRTRGQGALIEVTPKEIELYEGALGPNSSVK